MRKLLLAAVCLFAAAQTASAAAACVNEKLTKLIAHPDGNVYFMTSNKCKNSWCLLDPNWNGTAGSTSQAAKQMVYQGMINAFQNQNFVSMYFAGEANCNPTTTSLVKAQYLEFSK